MENFNKQHIWSHATYYTHIKCNLIQAINKIIVPAQDFLFVSSLYPSLQKHSTSLVLCPVVPDFKRQPCSQFSSAFLHNSLTVASKIDKLMFSLQYNHINPVYVNAMQCSAVQCNCSAMRCDAMRCDSWTVKT